MGAYNEPRMSGRSVKVAAIVLIALGIASVAAYESVKIVDAGHRGVLLHWSAVDLTHPPLDEGLHFVVPFQDDVVSIEVRTLKYEKETRAASKDLQTVATTVTVNYHPDKESIHTLYKNLGLDYESRVIQPAIEETVKQVTANYNAEELIAKRPLVKQDIEAAIRERLSVFNILTEVISITDFEFSPLFSRAVEAKVEAEQKALKAENDLRRIEVEARQREANAVGLANANIAEAKGEAEAISIINLALADNPNYLEWLKTQVWDGTLPLVVGKGGTPFIQIPVEPGR